MSSLSQLLKIVELNLCRKNVSDPQKKAILEKIEAKHQKGPLDDGKKSPEEEKKDIDKRIEFWQNYYAAEKIAGREVFGPEDKIDETKMDTPLEFGQTMLHRAVVQCNLEEIERLLKEGASPNKKDNGGMTPLMLAIMEEKVEVVKLFKKLGIE